MEDGQVVEERDTTLPLLLSPVSLISQWSDTEELVEPVRKKQGKRNKRVFHLFSIPLLIGEPL